MAFFGVFDFSRCFQVRIDVTVEAKQLGPWWGIHCGGLPQKLRKNCRKKLFESNGWSLINMSPQYGDSTFKNPSDLFS